MSSSELITSLKKDPSKVIETFKTNPYDAAIFKSIHNAAMQLSTQSAEWKALRNANFYEFYQTVLLASDKHKISVGGPLCVAGALLTRILVSYLG